MSQSHKDDWNITRKDRSPDVQVGLTLRHFARVRHAWQTHILIFHKLPLTRPRLRSPRFMIGASRHPTTGDRTFSLREKPWNTLKFSLPFLSPSLFQCCFCPVKKMTSQPWTGERGFSRNFSKFLGLSLIWIKGALARLFQLHMGLRWKKRTEFSSITSDLSIFRVSTKHSSGLNFLY